MEVALLLLLVLVVTRLRVTLHQSHHVDETRELDLNAVHSLCQTPHSGAN
jgi:phosphotransferase system IIB component